MKKLVLSLIAFLVIFSLLVGCRGNGNGGDDPSEGPNGDSSQSENDKNEVNNGNNGGSGVVTPAGRFTQYIGSSSRRPELLRDRAYGIVEVPVYPSGSGNTFYIRYGEWFILLLVLGMSAVVVCGIIFEQNRRRAAGSLINGENKK